MSKPLPKTSAEEALARQFKALASSLPGNAEVAAARTRAMAAFERTGLPHRRIEAYKYTDLRAAVSEFGAIAQKPTNKVSQTQLDALLGPLAKLSGIRVVFVDGKFDPSLSDKSAAKFVKSDDDVQLLSAKAPEDAMVALNAALATGGAVLALDGKTSGKPIHLITVAAASKPAHSAVRHAVSVAPGVAASVLEIDVTLSGAAPPQTNAVTSVKLGTGASLTHISVARSTSSSLGVATLLADIAESGNLRSFQVTTQQGMRRNQSFIRFSGEHSKIDISGLMLGRGREHIDTTLVIDHAVPKCESRELFKAVLDDSARAVFQGKVIVRQDAQKTDGKQMANALMLSENCEFDSKPELEIYADDVVCGHGATVAEIDPAQLFYLRTRGIPKNEARALLIESFAADALEKVEDDAIRAALQEIASDWFAARKGDA